MRSDSIKGLGKMLVTLSRNLAFVLVLVISLSCGPISPSLDKPGHTSAGEHPKISQGVSSSQTPSFEIPLHFVSAKEAQNFIQPEKSDESGENSIASTRLIRGLGISSLRFFRENFFCFVDHFEDYTLSQVIFVLDSSPTPEKIKETATAKIFFEESVPGRWAIRATDLSPFSVDLVESHLFDVYLIYSSEFSK